MRRRRMTVKRVDPWSVLKLGLVVNIAGAAILVVTGVVVWTVVRRLMLVERVCEQAQGLLGFENCAVDGVQVMRTGLMLAGLSVVVATGVMVFLAFLYNLIADLTGGIEVSALDYSGQPPSAGGVEVAPELRGETNRTRATPAPAPAPRAAVARSDPQPTVASAAARPPGSGPPLMNTQASPPTQASAAQGSSTTEAQPAAEEQPPAPTGPGVLERATGVVGAAGTAVKHAAERSGAAVKGAADKTGAKISEAGRRATTTLTDVTAQEAAERAARARLQREPLDQLATREGAGRSSRGSRSSSRSGSGGGATGGDEELPPRGDDGRFLSKDEATEATSSRGSAKGSSTGPSRAGSEVRRSPQEAAAERQRAKASRARSSPKSSGRAERSSRPKARDDEGDDEPELMFGNHPRAKSDDRG